MGLLYQSNPSHIGMNPDLILPCYPNGSHGIFPPFPGPVQPAPFSDTTISDSGHGRSRDRRHFSSPPVFLIPVVHVHFFFQLLHEFIFIDFGAVEDHATMGAADGSGSKGLFGEIRA